MKDKVIGQLVRALATLKPEPSDTTPDVLKDILLAWMLGQPESTIFERLRAWNERREVMVVL